MGKHIFKIRTCVTCSNPYVPTDSATPWCSLSCRLIDVIDCSGGPDACWPWKGPLHRQGYGVLKLPKKSYLAHRSALSILGGVNLTADDVVRHNCDNPPCCNWQRHLIIGTQADNIRDMITRGRLQDYSRIAHGEATGAATTTAETALAIFNDTEGGYTDIAERFGVTRKVVQGIKLGTTWNEVTGLKREARSASRVMTAPA